MGGARIARHVRIIPATALLTVALLLWPAPSVAVDRDPATARVSWRNSGGQANGPSTSPALSGDGRFVAFVSSATDLVTGDTNGLADVFVRDRSAGRTYRVSVAGGGGQANGASSEPAITPDGRYVAFASHASNLVPDDGNGTVDVFVRDRTAGTTTRVSVSSSERGGSGQSWGPAISADGRYVAFVSYASDLVAGDTNGAHDVFLRDRVAGTTNRPSWSNFGEQPDRASGAPSISAGGRFVAFHSWATNLVAGDSNGVQDVFVRDREWGATYRISVSGGGAQGNRASAFPSVSGDGRFVAFQSTASNLVPGDTNGVTDVFLRDRSAAATSRVSRCYTGTQTLRPSEGVSMASGGRFVAFASRSTCISPGPSTDRRHVFVHDRLTGWAARASIATEGVAANADSYEPAVTNDGRQAAFHSSASNLGPSDTNGVSDVFVRAPLAIVPASLVGTEWNEVPTSARVVALTFDAGANADGIPSIMATLDRENVPGTFFLTGRWVQTYPGYAAQIGSRYPVANHTNTHPDLTTLSDVQVRNEIQVAHELIAGATGRDPRPVFRFPFGARDARTIRIANSLGYGSLRWTVDTLGWQGTSGGQTVDRVVDRVLANLRPGEVVLMHVGSHPTDGSTLDADALPRIIQEIRARGYGFVTTDPYF